MRADDLLTVVRWLSPAHPTGGFAWSHGLEAAVAAGQVATAIDLEDWLADALALGSGRTDAILLAAAHRSDGTDLADLAELAAALAPSAERLSETLQQGAAFAAVTRATRGWDLPDMAYPVAVGRAAALAGLPPVPVAQVFLQAFASNLVQAALRLLPLGQTAGAALLDCLAPLCARVADDAATLGPEDIGSAAVAIDIAAMRHETLQPRMFRS